MSGVLQDVIRRNGALVATAIPAVCSSLSDVLRTAGFAALVKRLCIENGIDPDKRVLGGDHAGPQVRRKEPAAVAMNHSAVMMAAYVQAGVTKIYQGWSQVCCLAVKPGKAFSPSKVHHLPPGGNAALCAVLLDWDAFTGKARSTEFQNPETYPRRTAKVQLALAPYFFGDFAHD